MFSFFLYKVAASQPDKQIPCLYIQCIPGKVKEKLNKTDISPWCFQTYVLNNVLVSDDQSMTNKHSKQQSNRLKGANKL